MRDGIRPSGGPFIPLAEIELKTSRSSGPGGQHANVTESRVEAVFDVSASTALTESHRQRITARLGPVVRAVSQEARSQARNRELALERLEEKLAKALEVKKPRRATRPSRAARERRLQAKRQRSKTKRSRGRPDFDD